MRTRTLTLVIVKRDAGVAPFRLTVKAALLEYIARLDAGTAGLDRYERVDLPDGVSIQGAATCEPPL